METNRQHFPALFDPGKSFPRDVTYDLDHRALHT